MVFLKFRRIHQKKQDSAEYRLYSAESAKKMHILRLLLLMGLRLLKPPSREQVPLQPRFFLKNRGSKGLALWWGVQGAKPLKSQVTKIFFTHPPLL